MSDSIYPQSRAEARSQASRFYFTGVPCHNNHIGRRFTKSGECESCKRDLDAKYREQNKELIKQRAKLWSSQNREKQHNSRLKTTYGITTEQRQQMFDKQNGKCAICSRQLDTFEKRSHIDHCHTTGKVRELLCSRCNNRLSGVEDKEWLQAAIAYVEKHKLSAGGV